MYKTYITKWGLDKKNKEPEMRAIVRKYKQREAQGKGSIIRVRKQQRNFADVVRYWERKGVSIDDIIARQTASPTPEAVEFSTPVSSPIAAPPELAIPEQMLRCIRDYFKSSFESGTWVRTEPESRCYSLKDENGANSMWAGFRSDCELACILFEQNLSHEAGQILISTTASIKKILSTEHPETLIELYGLVFHLRYTRRRDEKALSILRRRRDEIALSILRQFSAMSEVVLGIQHPLTRFCEWSVSVYASVFVDTVTKCMEVMSNEFASSVGRTHLSTLVFRVHFIVTMSTDSRARIQKLQKLLGECEQTLRPDDYRVLYVRGYMADECFGVGRYDEAMTLSQKNIDYYQDRSSMSAVIYGYSDDLYLLGKCQYAIGEVDLGIATLCEAIDSILSIWGPQDGRARRWLLVLEDWYVEQGLWESAAHARETRLELQAWIDTDCMSAIHYRPMTAFMVFS